MKRRRNADDPWPRFVPVLWLLGTWLGLAIAAAAYAQLAGDDSPLPDCIVSVLAAVLVTAFALSEREAIARALRVRHLGLREWAWTLVALVAIAVVIEAWFWLVAMLSSSRTWRRSANTAGRRGAPCC